MGYATIAPVYRDLHRTLLPLCLAFLAATASFAEEATVDVTIDSSPGSTRLVLTHSQPVVYVIEDVRGKVRIRYAEPVRLEPAEQRINDGILERYRIHDGRTLTLFTDRQYYSYESFELRNPFRLIVDLRGDLTKQDTRIDKRREWRGPQTIIVIDPGHGGIEHGAVGPTGLMEKDITLALAKRLKRALRRADRSLSVVLTRDEDRLVGLDERTAIANHNRADLFLSIHLNASPRKNATGAETYYLSTDATDEQARILAAQENRASGAGPKPGDGLDLVLWELAQNQYLAESSALAGSVQHQLNRLTGTRNRGVRQAPFRVLMGATMPAVLVEVGFISNADEEARFYSSQYQQQVVDAITTAVQKFLRNLRRFSEPQLPGTRADRP